MNMTFVTHDGYRWKLVGQETEEGRTLLALQRHDPKRGTINMAAWESECSPYVRSAGTRRIRGTKPHRKGRPVVFEYDQQTGVITLRLKRARKGFTTTLEGLYDICARQQAANARRDAAFKRRTRRRTR